MRHAMLLVCLLCTSVQGHAATSTVSPSGNDATPCGQGPRQTITAGAQCLSGGDTLLVQAGLYAEALDRVLPSGTQGAPTTLKAQGEVEIRPPNTNGPLLRIQGSWIVVDGVIVDGRNQNPYIYLVEVADGSSYVTIQNSEVRNVQDTCDNWGSGGAGITTGHHTDHTTLRGNHVHHIQRYGPVVCPTNTTVHGIYATGSYELIEGNVIHDNAGWGVHYYATAVPVVQSVVRCNLVYNNGSTGIQIGSGDGSLAEHNIIYGNGRGLILGRYGIAATNQVARNNTLVRNTVNCIINGATGSTITRNICWQNSPDAVQEEGSSTQSGNLFGVDPRFVGAALSVAADFAMQPGSPALPDIGANPACAASGLVGKPRYPTPTNLRLVTQ